MVKLHLGCGKCNFGKSWTHIDAQDLPHVSSHRIDLLPFVSNGVDLIYASHVIEHVTRSETKLILQEWNRVLKSGGILRIAVPDFQVLAALYCQNKITLSQVLGPLYGSGREKEWSIDCHRTTYDYNDLKHMLLSCGFNKIRLWDWRKTEHSHFDDFSQAYIPHMDKENGTLISLNVEAIKLKTKTL